VFRGDGMARKQPAVHTVSSAQPSVLLSASPATIFGGGAMRTSKTYALSCSGPGGTSVQSASVTAAPAARTGTVTLSWLAPTTNTNDSPVTQLSGNKIYYGNSPSALTQSVVVKGASSTGYEITGLASGTWYFGVAAKAADEAESAMSNVGSETI
jgi:hypothetical protein